MQLSPLIQFFNGRACLSLLRFHHCFEQWRCNEGILNDDFYAALCAQSCPLATGNYSLVRASKDLIELELLDLSLLRPYLSFSSPRRPTADVKHSTQ
jgi:hypothetical protein